MGAGCVERSRRIIELPLRTSRRAADACIPEHNRVQQLPNLFGGKLLSATRRKDPARASGLSETEAWLFDAHPDRDRRNARFTRRELDPGGPRQDGFVEIPGARGCVELHAEHVSFPVVGDGDAR